MLLDKKPEQLQRQLRCYAHPYRGAIIAGCLNLNLLVVADTLPEAVQKLHEVASEILDMAAQDGHLEDVLRGPSMMMRFDYFGTIVIIGLLKGLFSLFRFIDGARASQGLEVVKYNEPIPCYS